MVIENTYPNLSNVDQTVFELDRVIQTVGAADDPGITANNHVKLLVNKHQNLTFPRKIKNRLFRHILKDNY